MSTFGNIPNRDNRSERQENNIISNITPDIDSRRPSRTLSQNITSTHRRAGQLASCCSTYANLSASDLCSLYSQDCTSGKTKSHDDGDQSCTQQGLSFIGISFSVSSKYGNPYSYQLCDQFPMENLIDREYKYVMSMDEDGWLVGGGYKQLQSYFVLGAWMLVKGKFFTYIPMPSLHQTVPYLEADFFHYHFTLYMHSQRHIHCASLQSYVINIV
jgi:hypothetical protein